MYTATTSYTECEAACTSVPDCIGFDIDVNPNCNGRFATNAILDTSTIPFGYTRWNIGCNDCDISLMTGTNGSTTSGHCWAKVPGNGYLTNNNGNWNTGEPSDTCVN